MEFSKRDLWNVALQLDLDNSVQSLEHSLLTTQMEPLILARPLNFGHATLEYRRPLRLLAFVGASISETNSWPLVRSRGGGIGETAASLASRRQ